MEVPSIAAGTLAEIRVPEGEVAKVGAVVAIISVDGSAAVTGAAKSGAPPAPTESASLPPGNASPFVPAKAGAQNQAAVGPRSRGDERAASPASFAYEKLDPFFEVRTPSRNFGPARLPGGAPVTPLARRLAAESGIDLRRISASGPRGRIVAGDVEQALPKGALALAMASSASAAQIKALYQGAPYEEVPLDGMRAAIARRLVEAKQTIPHFYLTSDVEVEKLLAFREEANSGAPLRDGEPAYKLSVNDFVIKGLALALQRVPAANAVWAGDRILRFRQSDVGVAVAIDGGLLTPVIRNAEGKSLAAISNEMRDLATRARAKRLKLAEFQGGSTAISNLGMYGVREFAAVINPPHATILAIGAAQRRPVEAADGSVKFVSQMTVTLSCDHRVVDGALGAELLAAFKGLLESPVRMLV
jgi:pyruvate dehydrogenase E2 component (dihydrolipoamide acetyltransferase)